LVERDFIQFSSDTIKKFLNWLRTSCVVSITTVPKQWISGLISNNVLLTWQYM